MSLDEELFDVSCHPICLAVSGNLLHVVPHQDALACLQTLEYASPLEVNVYFLQARIYKLKKDIDNARRALTKAQAFMKDPAVVRDAIDRLQGENQDPDGEVWISGKFCPRML